MQIPFLDLSSQTNQVAAAFLEKVESLTKSNSFIGGLPVTQFEEDFANYCGTAHCVALNSGTDGLRLGLLAAGAEASRTVITSPFTFIATAEAISQTCKLDLADVDFETFTLSPSAVAERLTSRTQGILPVHIFGLASEMPELQRLAAERGLFVLEDACQAHGASVVGTRVGGSGIGAAFSFYPSKNLSAFGDAGAFTTNDAEIAEKVRVLRNHGQTGPYYHELEGFNSRMDTFQAAVLGLKLRFLDQWNNRRREIARVYRERLGRIPDVRFQRIPEGYEHVYHVFALLVGDSRDRLASHLADRGVDTRVIYPTPIHLMPAYKHLGYQPGDFPNSERISREVLCLPMYPGLTDPEVEFVASEVSAFFGGK